MRFFKSKNIEDLKKEYRKLAKELHPDMGGDTRTFQDMQAEFIELCKRLANVHKQAENTEPEEETAETPEEFMNVVNQVIILDGVEVEIVGRWVWVSGNTYANKDKIKKAGFFYSSKHKKWYWNGGSHKSKKHSRLTFEEVKRLHGSMKVKSQLRLATA